MCNSLINGLARSSVLTLSWESDLIEDRTRPDTYLYDMHGNISLESGKGTREVIGKFEIYLVDVHNGINIGLPGGKILDARENTRKYCRAVYDYRLCNYEPPVYDLLKGECVELDMLIVEKIQLLPKYRGVGLGFRVMRLLIERIARDCGVIAMAPVPSQFDSDASKTQTWLNRLDLARYSASREESTRKLTEHFARLDFKPLDGTPLLIRPGVWTRRDEKVLSISTRGITFLR